MNKNLLITKTRNYIAFAFLLNCFASLCFAQSQIYVLDFESGQGVGYSTSIEEFNDGGSDYFTWTDNNSVGGDYSGVQGTYFFAAQDIDGEGASPQQDLYINNINVSGYTDLELRVYLAEDDAGGEKWDDNDYTHFSVDIDNSGNYTDVLNIESSASGFNSAPAIDTNFDGMGNGTIITNTFTQFTASIPATGDNLDLRVRFVLDSGGEDIAIDHIEIYGNLSGVNVGPAITNIVQTPATSVTPSDAVTVSAEVTDSDDIASVVLNWGTSSGMLNNTISMNLASGDTYVTASDIPSQANGTTVFYEIEATDDNSTPGVTTTEEQSYVVDDSYEVMVEDFQDCGSISFTTVSVSSNADWECSNSDGYMQINAYGADEAADDYLISEELNLDSYTNEILTFESYNQYSDSGVDGAEVELLYTNAYTGDPTTTTWESVTATFASEDSSTWTSSGEIDLSSISGSTVRIAFHHTSSGTGGGSTSLWRIDNVQLSGILEGNVGPEITNISQNPSTVVTTSDAVVVSADVTDDDGVASVVLNWGTESGNLPNEITMNLSSGDTYTTTNAIPAQAEGTTVYYEIVATDANTSPETSTSIEQNYTSLDPLGLIITEVADPQNAADAKFVEIYNNGSSTLDFSTETIYLAKYSNGGASPQTVQLTGTLAAGEYYTIAYSESEFSSEYGFSANLVSGVISGNGDDVYALFFDGDDNSGTLLDIYGEIGVDGTGEDWEYEDSRAVRNSLSYQPSATWIASQWDIVAANTEDMTPNSGEATVYTYTGGVWSPANPEGNATSSDNIIIENGEVNFSSDISINDLVINSDGVLTIEAVLQVNGDITNDGEITFISNALTTGQLDEFNGSITGNEINVQRYIPEGTRAFRFLTSTVTTSASIYANWQENGVETENFGTHITGSTTGENGFDTTPSGNPSLFTFDNGYENANEAWLTVENTNVNTLIAGEPYRILIRGDRTIDVTQNNSTPTATTLRATGTLATGDQITSLGSIQDHFNFVGNPYQAIVDMNLVLANSTNLNTNQYYVWDPNMNTQGAYVTVDLSTGTPTSSGSSANQFLQPGQAAFVTTLTDASSSILFEESDKATEESMTSVFRNSNEFDTSVINIDLQTQASYVNNGAMADGALVKFVANASNGIEANDAMKLGNIDETLSIVNGEHYLSIETRDLPQVGETIPFYLNSYRQEDYVFRINLNNISEVTPYLVDDYLGTQTPLVNNEENVVSFSVDEANAESVSPTRFSILFAEASLANSNVEKNSFMLYPNPTKSGEFTIQLSGSNGASLEVKLFDMLGKEVYNKQFKTFENQLKVKDTSLKTGIYLVQLNQNGKTSTQKLIVK